MARFLPLDPSTSSQELSIWQATHGDRKAAEVVNREFLGWLSQARTPGRPFFAFLNYADAHAPYVLPSGASYRFGSTPPLRAISCSCSKAGFERTRGCCPGNCRDLARDSYDNCLAYLDERLGELFDELRRQGVLDRTLVILTADHGEGLGEHELFDHGESLYRTEIRVPLLISASVGRKCPQDRDRIREPSGYPCDDRRPGQPGESSTLPRRLGGSALGGESREIGTNLEAGSNRSSPNSRGRIPRTRTRVDRRPIAGRSSPSSRVIMPTSETKRPGPKNSSMNGKIPARS